MRRLNLTGKQQPGSASVSDGLSGFGGAAQSQLTTLLGTTFGQGLSSLTKGGHGGCQGAAGCGPPHQLHDAWLAEAAPSLARPYTHLTPVRLILPAPAGVKNLLAGEQQAAVTVAMEALMEGKPNLDTEAYAVFDPKVWRVCLAWPCGHATLGSIAGCARHLRVHTHCGGRSLATWALAP